jgi:Beta-glucan synthesis-associated protein SKN1/KRE6/Sbg1
LTFAGVGRNNSDEAIFLGTWSREMSTTDTNAALHYYSHDNARTTNGVLNITTERKTNVYKAFDEVKKEFYVDKKYIQSGMLQSWNKFCFIGGAVEFSAKLPGDPHKGGLWPARKSCSRNSVRYPFVASPHTRRNLGTFRIMRQFGCLGTWRGLHMSVLQTLSGHTATTNATREIERARK